MSVKLRNRIRSSPLLLTRGEKIVLICLADYARDDGTGIYPGMIRLAGDVLYSERWVRKILRQLEERGLIHNHGTIGGRGHTTKYSICIEALFPAPGPPPNEPFLPDESPQMEDDNSPLILLQAKLQKARQTLQERQDQQAFKMKSGNRSYTLDSLIERSQERVDQLEQELAQLTSAQREYQPTRGG